ncbi:LysM-like peptidoglycan-binding domain-containing protein [Vibrio metoecus]|uniref:LysM-like peptidoglycan-binding domain-containing protein n=1 Tax=Vibrio metoecus TaxID=1481663 RepID=UPI00215D4A78|nr:LysM-like peptidoglycan-binding domain-containing protein [Vibrio metoecus]MCR9385812.1 lysine transporter LysM [Vibrio metoecus]
MNRRHKKPQQTDYLAQVQVYWQQLDWPRYRQQLRELWLRLPLRHRRGLMVLTPAVLVLTVIPLPDKQEAVNEAASTPKRIEVGMNTQSLSEQRTQAQAELKSSAWQEYVVRQGDTLSQVFRNNELPLTDINALVKVEGSDKPLSQIQAGQLIRFKLAENGQLDILQLERNNQSVMFFRLSDGGFGRSK